MALTIGLLGDVMLGRKVGEELATVDPREVWSPELRALVSACDLLICNLECAISDRGRPTTLIPGKPFFFRAPPQAIDSLHAIGVKAVGLANNHALDYGPLALADTVECLRSAGIAVAGAGPGTEDARAGAEVECAGKRVGLLALSDHPREYAAGADRWGIAWSDLSRGASGWVTERIAELRSRSDFVIAFPHWGPNMVTRPARWQKDRAGELIDAGADLVAGHSAHVFGGVQFQSGQPVLYDLGDALDDYAVDAELRNDLGILALWRPDTEPTLELVGLRLDFAFTELATGDDADWIARRLERACAELGTRVERLADERFRVVPSGAHGAGGTLARDGSG